jgi:hypothetical protein
MGSARRKQCVQNKGAKQDKLINISYNTCLLADVSAQDPEDDTCLLADVSMDIDSTASEVAQKVNLEDDTCLLTDVSVTQAKTLYEWHCALGLPRSNSCDGFIHPAAMTAIMVTHTLG